MIMNPKSIPKSKSDIHYIYIEQALFGKTVSVTLSVQIYPLTIKNRTNKTHTNIISQKTTIFFILTHTQIHSHTHTTLYIHI